MSSVATGTSMVTFSPTPGPAQTSGTLMAPCHGFDLPYWLWSATRTRQPNLEQASEERAGPGFKAA
eukprot:scaffold133104_cov63-Phaeocystis_antarctica.AAC.2